MFDAYDRYISDVMRSIWSINNKYNIWLMIEKQVIRYLNKTNKCPDGCYNEISSISITQSVIDEIQMRERILKHDVLAFVEVISDKLSASTSSAFHRGLTSSDLVDTGNAIMITKALDIVLSELFRLIDNITSMINLYGHLYQVGRTHGIHTEPIKLSHKFNIWLDELFRNKERLELVREQIAVGKLSGPVGMRSGDIDFAAEQMILNEFGIRVETSANQIVQRDRYAFLVSTIAILAGSIEKFATEIRNLSRSEVSEFSEGFSDGQKGSSSMPHKRNPIMSENLCGLARLMRGMSVVALENQSLWHERDISHSSAERFMLPIVTGLAEAMLKRMRITLMTMTINEKKLKINLHGMNGYNMSAVVLYKLQKAGMPRNEAYNLVKDIVDANTGDSVFSYEISTNEKIRAYLSNNDIDEIFNQIYYGGEH
jgi:adenylosuccinate lyase